MNHKIALVVYPEFSFQEVANLCGLFRWHYESETVVFASDVTAVKAEEGMLIQPHASFDAFQEHEYDCLILPGCSDLRVAIRDKRLEAFLRRFQGSTLPIGAICSGPLLLAKAGLMEGRYFINSAYVQMNQLFPFVDERMIRYQPVVEDGPIVTAIGPAFNEFAIAMARKLGYSCSDHIYTGIQGLSIEDALYELDEESLQEMIEEFQDLLHP